MTQTVTALWIAVGLLVVFVLLLGARLIQVEERLHRHERWWGNRD